MKCCVHVGFDPRPKVAAEPAKAIAIAEKYLLSENNESIKNEHLSIKWRRDDLYPHNFLEYNKDDLMDYLVQEGEVVLQLAEIDEDGLPIMGEIANIFTDTEEEKNTKEAQEALHSRGESLSYTYKSIDFTKKRRKIDRRYSN